jgi:hypothetical protein
MLVTIVNFLSLSALVLYLFLRPAAAETPLLDSDVIDPPTIEEPFLFPYAFSAGIRQPFERPVARTFSLDLAPRIIELKTSYLEKRETGNAFTNWSSEPKVGNFLDVVATSSPFDGRLVGEGELAYSTLSFSTTGEQRPTMSRLGLKGNWAGMSYGADYKSFGSGFAAPSGVKIDHDRDESQVWSQYNFGFLRVKSAIGELWEKNSDTNQLSLTRTAITSLNLSKSNWNALLSSNYSVLRQGTGFNEKIVAFTNGLSFSYRPTTILTIEPNLGLKDEWDRSTGLRTETPSAGLVLLSTPLRDVQLTGRASYARGISEDPFKDGSTINTGASLNWKLGKSLIGEQFLSFQIEYKNQLFLNSPSNSQEHLSGLLQLKIVGF